MTNLALYGIDWNAPLGTDEEPEAVEIPPTRSPLTRSDYAQLQQLIDPALDSGHHGIEQYLTAVRFVESKVSEY